MVIAIELLDLSFALDSIISGLAFIAPFDRGTSAINPKLWILYLGAVLGILGIRFAAHLFSRLLQKYPQLEATSYLLIGWIGLRLFFDAIFKPFQLNLNEFPWLQPLFWIGIAFFFLLGFRKGIKDGTRSCKK